MIGTVAGLAPSERTDYAIFFAPLRFLRLRFHLRALRDGELPRRGGPLLRSAFGASLRAVCCPNQRRDCADCVSRESCAYLYLFETPRPPGATRLRGADAVPHPYVLRPWPGSVSGLVRGDEIELETLLVGQAADLLPHVVVAVGRMAAAGLGRERVTFKLETIEQVGQGPRPTRRLIFDDRRQVAEPKLESVELAHLPGRPDSLTLDITSPMHLVAGGLQVKRIQFHSLVRALLRRMSSLAAFHCDEPLTLDYQGLVDRAGRVSVAGSDLRLVSFSCHSARQGRRIPLSGLQGRVTFAGQGLAEFLPLLALGEMLHVGKWTAFGMGRYQIVTGEGQS